MSEAKAKPVYTAAQLRAFAWLPVDGSWRNNAGNMRAALSSLDTFHSKHIDSEWSFIGSRSRYRLTPSGIAEKKRLIEEGTIQGD